MINPLDLIIAVVDELGLFTLVELAAWQLACWIGFAILFGFIAGLALGLERARILYFERERNSLSHRHDRIDRAAGPTIARLRR